MIKKNLEEYKGTAIYAQQVDGKLSPIALELLGKARALANDLDDKTVTAVLIGYQVGGLVDELAAYGADKVVVIDGHGVQVAYAGGSHKRKTAY